MRCACLVPPSHSHWGFKPKGRGRGADGTAEHPVTVHKRAKLPVNKWEMGTKGTDALSSGGSRDPCIALELEHPRLKALLCHVPDAWPGQVAYRPLPRFSTRKTEVIILLSLCPSFVFSIQTVGTWGQDTSWLYTAFTPMEISRPNCNNW